MGARTNEGHSEKTAQRTRTRARTRPSTLAKRLLRGTGAILLSHSPRASDPISQENPLTGKPDARNGPVRFGGRGEVQTLVPTPIAGESATKNWTFGNQASSSLKNCGCRPASHQTSGRSRRTTPGCWSGSGSSRRVEASKMWRPMSRATITGQRSDARVACQRASNAHSLPRLPSTSQPS
jgi:hypothetical protein